MTIELSPLDEGTIFTYEVENSYSLPTKGDYIYLEKNSSAYLVVETVHCIDTNSVYIVYNEKMKYLANII